jgi:hypothetical protein
MAQSYGSVAHPVDLGPFSRIVDVHWNSGKYIAFPLLIQRRSVIKNYPFPAQAIGEVGQTEQPVDWTVDAEASPVPGAGPTGDTTYATGFQYEYGSNTQPAPGYGGYGKGASGNWSTLRIDEFEGLPSLPDQRALAAWSVLFFVLGTTDSVLSWWPRAEYQPVVGTALDVKVPGHDDIAFKSVSSVTLQMRGIAFTGGPNQGGEFDLQRSPYTDTPFNVKYGTTGPVNVGTEEGIDHIFETLSVNISDIRVTRNGKTYHAIGAAHEPNPALAPINPGTLWILCEKETTTS